MDRKKMKLTSITFVTFICYLLLINITYGFAGEKKTLSESAIISLGYTRLPPLDKRKIIGTWFNEDFQCTMTIENFDGNFYEVKRFKDDARSEDHGKKLIKLKEYFVIPGSEAGDKYKIMPDGRLGRFDNQGLIDILAKHDKLWPMSPAEIAEGQRLSVALPPKAEDMKTVGLKCYDVGYRYGHTATSSMKGKKVNPSWDFATPERCRNDPETVKGIQAGTRAAW